MTVRCEESYNGCIENTFSQLYSRIAVGALMEHISNTPKPNYLSSLNREPKEKMPAESSAAKDEVRLGEQEDPVLPDAVKPHKKWLFMNYIAGDTNLTLHQLKNIENQQKVGSDDHTHMVAYVDVGPRMNPMDQSWNGCRSYYITKSDEAGIHSELTGEYGNLDMSDPETLTKFIVDAMGKYPSEYTCLVMNSHGGGFVGAMSDDTEGKGGMMRLPGMREAMEKAREITGKKIDIIGFDACHMGELEVAYELRDQAGILIGSEETERGPGWKYSGILSDSNTAEGSSETDGKQALKRPDESSPFQQSLSGNVMNEALGKLQESMLHRIKLGPAEFAKLIVRESEQNNKDIPTLSAVDLERVGAVKDALNQLAVSVLEADDKEMEAVRSAIEQTENYGDNWVPYADLRDIGHLADNLMLTSGDPKILEAAQEIKKSLEDAVLANQNNAESHPNSQGLSIYAPTDKKELDSSIEKHNYGKLAFASDTSWQEMLEALALVNEKKASSSERVLRREDIKGLDSVGRLAAADTGNILNSGEISMPLFQPDIDNQA